MPRKSIYILLLFCFYFAFSAITQSTEKLAEWQKIYKEENNEIKIRFDYLDSILLYWRKTDIDSSLYYVRVYLQLADKEDQLEEINYANSNIASLHRFKGDYDSSIYYYEKALIGYEKADFMDGIAVTYGYIANVYKQQSRYDLAIKNYFNSLEILNQSDNPSLLINLYSSLAGLYFRLENYTRAEEYWKLAQENVIGTELEATYTFAARGLARIAMQRYQFNEAEDLLNKILKIDEEYKNRIYLYEDYLAFLELYSKTQNHVKFYDFQQKAIQSRDIESPVNLEHFYEFSGDFYFNGNEYHLAKIYYDSCIQTLQDFSQSSSSSFLESLNRLMSKKFYTEVLLMNPQKFKPFYDQLTLIAQEADNIKKTYIAQELDAQYSIKEIQEENSLLNKQNKIYGELNRKNKNQIILLAITLILAFIFVFYTVYNNRKIRKIKLQLEANITEKEFLFKELNHRVKNNLLIVNSFIGIEKRNKSQDVNNILSKIENRIHSLGLLHEVLYRSKMEETIELGDYIKKFVQSFQQTISDGGITILPQIENDIQININKVSYIGLIINELITNSCKYAKIDGKELSVYIKISEEIDNINIEISDDGIGLPANFDTKDSYNFKIAKGLTKQLKGELIVKQPEIGTVFSIIIPRNKGTLIT